MIPRGADTSTPEVDSVRVWVQRAAYSVDAIEKTAYRLAAECTVVIEPCVEDRLPLLVMFPRRMTPSEAHQVTLRFFRELTDQELRERIAAETREIRTVLIAHAFSRTGLIRE